MANPIGSCGDSSYTQITYETLFDLDKAFLVVGTIVSINRPANVAEVTIDDSIYPSVSGKALDTVPFFYHCEESTGTIEDLARGNEAFRINDIVYILQVPATSSVVERFYIIGHVNIRSTNKCGLSEYIFIGVRKYFMIDSVVYNNRFYTVYDVMNNRILDLESFENLDEDSPPKPTVFPVEFSDELNDWFIYNFRDSVPGYLVPATVGITEVSVVQDASFTDISESGGGTYSGWSHKEGYDLTVQGWHNLETSSWSGEDPWLDMVENTLVETKAELNYFRVYDAVEDVSVNFYVYHSQSSNTVSHIYSPFLNNQLYTSTISCILSVQVTSEFGNRNVISHSGSISTTYDPPWDHGEYNFGGSLYKWIHPPEHPDLDDHKLIRGELGVYTTFILKARVEIHDGSKSMRVWPNGLENDYEYQYFRCTVTELIAPSYVTVFKDVEDSDAIDTTVDVSIIEVMQKHNPTRSSALEAAIISVHGSLTDDFIDACIEGNAQNPPVSPNWTNTELVTFAPYMKKTLADL